MDKLEEAREILRFVGMPKAQNTYYGSTYAENSRETFRKQALHRFRTAAMVEDNGKATNSPNYRYRLTDETLTMIKCYQSAGWDMAYSRYMEYHDKLIDIYASKKKMTMMPVKINGADFSFLQENIMSCRKQ